MDTNIKEDILTIEQIDESHDLLESLLSKLVVHNDDVNTFDWVIESLIDICGHTTVQAEQCAMIIHYKGKYTVNKGEFEELKPMKNALIDRGINATIEK